MKLLTWNILSGGSKARIPDIVLNLIAHDPDILVLTEFRSGKSDRIADVLREMGWPFQVSSNPPPNVHGILLASRLPFAPTGFQTSVPHRAVEAAFGNLTVLGVHIPDSGQMGQAPVLGGCARVRADDVRQERHNHRRLQYRAEH